MKLRRICALSLALISAYLSGCVPSPLSVREATSTATVAARVRQIYADAGVTLPTSHNPDSTPAILESGVFAQVGYQIVDSSCSDYFDAVTKASNGLKMTKSDTVALGVAAATIASLAKASAKQVGIAAAAFGLAGVTIDNFEQYAYATPYPTQTRGLILKALAAYRQSSPPSIAKTIPDALDQIAGYANLCTYAGIASLVEDSIAKATPGDASSAAVLFSDKDKTQFLQPINASLGLPASAFLPDNDYVVLAAIADPTVTIAANGAQLAALVGMLSSQISPSSLQSKIYDKTTTPPTKHDLTTAWGSLSSLMASNAGFAAKVTATKKSTSGGVASPPADTSGKVPPIRIL